MSAYRRIGVNSVEIGGCIPPQRITWGSTHWEIPQYLIFVFFCMVTIDRNDFLGLIMHLNHLGGETAQDQLGEHTGCVPQMLLTH